MAKGSDIAHTPRWPVQSGLSLESSPHSLSLSLSLSQENTNI